MAPSSLATALAALSLAALLAPGCTSSSTVVDEAEAPAASADTAKPAPSAVETAKPAETAKPVESAAAVANPAASATPAAGGKKAGGAACDTAGECDSGICEGEGCGAGQGKCADKERKCTMDLRAYCGCDGKTFNGGGNCPKGRFSKKGPCDGDPGPGPKIPLPKKP